MPPETLIDVRAAMAELYARHARRIADALDDKPLCVVTGPRRFGKTTSLLPALAGMLQKTGKSTHIVNGRDYEVDPFSVDTLPPEHVDVLIIDEANSLTWQEKRMQAMLRLLHERGKAIVALITYHMGFEAGAVQVAETWQRAELAGSGEACAIVCLPQMIVTPALARSLLSSYCAVKAEPERSRLIDYIVDRAPLNPHVLLELGRARSIAELNRIVQQRRINFFQGAVSLDEYRQLERSLVE